ncbi:transformation/transcription domain-associated protein [Clonorchis sinensis]|uniref:Transformation/transcription domain-associated protein n=1 Tax=Clonorchis sinensis TaxID=79923 RepID=H2KT17_CLOSI|nr:transformation/transcription domain-associated protein [Clonorchis sinensis]
MLVGTTESTILFTRIAHLLILSFFFRGDEATKNFGYATQMQDNLHTVWSIYGDFLENVYSGYPATKRELAVSTTGIFAMQALMEAASVTGGSERRSRADVAKCLWLLTLDDTKGQQRLARTFEERSSRVRPDAFLPWLPNLVYSLLRPEGRFVASALRGVIASHPTMLYSLLRGLQHQLSTEVRYDDKLGQLLEKESPDSNAFLSALRSRVSALGSQSKDSDSKHSRGPFASMGTSGAELDSQQRSVPGSSTCGTKSINTTSSNGSVSASTINTSGSHTTASKKKKRVIVVMRGVEGERLAGSAISPSHPKSLDEYESTDSPVNSTSTSRKTAIRSHDASSGAGGEEATDEPDDVDLDDDNEDGDTEREDVEMLSQTVIDGKSVTSDDKFPGNLGAKTGSELSAGPDSEEQSVPTQNETVGTRCLSAMVVESLHRVNLLMNQLRRRHAVRIYALDLFTNEVGGKLQPTWAEQLLAQLCSILDYLHRLSWATVSPGRSWRVKNLTKLCIPNWLASELRFVGTSCGLRIQSPFQEDDAFLKDPPLLSPPITSPSRESVKPSTSRERSSSSSESESELEDVKPPVRSKLSDDSSGRSKGDAANKGVTKGGRTTISKPSSVQWTTSMPAYDEVENLMTAKLAAEALADPWFSYIRERLANEMSDLEGRPILDVIQRLTRCWIPLVEARVARLPARLHLSDCGAIRLLEMSSLIVGNHMPLVSPNTGCASPTPSTLPGSPCLELPGESGLFQGAASAVHSLAVGPFLQAQITNTANSNLSAHLVIADVLPHVARIRCSAGRVSPPARRLGLRASNGRVFYYDLACLGHLITSNTAAIQHEALAGARTQFLTMARGRASTLGHLTSEGLCGPAYKRWRQNGPLQLFQLINDMLAAQPETAKRNLALFVPRIMEVGPMGLCLTEVGASAPASNVVNACAHPLPSANPVSARGLTVLTRPPPLSAVSGVTSGCATSAGTKVRPPSWALPFDRIEATGGPNSDAHQHFPYKPSLPNPPPAPVPSVIGTTGSGVCNTAGGSSAVAAEAIGRPSGVDAGCHPACITLSGILEHSCTTWKHHTISTTATNSNVTCDHASRSVVLDSAGNVVKNSSLPSNQQYATPRELVCSYYEHLMDVVKHTPRTKVDTTFLVNLFTKLSDRMPQYPHLKSPIASTLGVLPESEGLSGEYSESTAAEFKRGSLVRRWAAYRMLDAESYWLLRHSVAAHLGLIALMEQLFHLTPLHPGCLVVDARSGRADARQLVFNLPHNVDMTLDLNLRPQLSSGVSDKSGPSTQLAMCFTNAMTLRAPKACTERSTSKPDTMNDTHHTVNSGSSFWRITANPVPFRLTPNLAGFICLPGAPTNTGPFAASYTTAAQALHNSQRSHSLSSLYRTILRGDYILWHRGRQAAVHAFQLLIGEQPWPSDPLPSSDSDSDEAEGGTRRKTKLFDELGVTALRSSHVERETEQISTVTLVPDLTNEHLIQLISFTVDAMQGTLKTVSEYSAPEPNSWNFMNLATDPSRLVQMSPDWLPWL